MKVPQTEKSGCRDTSNPCPIVMLSSDERRRKKERKTNINRQPQLRFLRQARQHAYRRHPHGRHDRRHIRKRHNRTLLPLPSPLLFPQPLGALRRRQASIRMGYQDHVFPLVRECLDLGRNERRIGVHARRRTFARSRLQTHSGHM